MKFHVVRSSAGSGKTYTLVKFYLRLILAYKSADYFKHILAITFTNKATNEMKQRVLDALASIAADENRTSQLAADLCEELKLERSELTIRATRTLKSVLHAYGDFNIATIDGFIYRIIRTFAFELDLPSGVEIELKNERLIGKVIDALFNSMSSNETLTKILIEFSAYKFSEDKSYNLERDIFILADDIMKSGGRDYLEHLAEFSIEDFYEKRKLVVQRRIGLLQTLKNMAGPIFKKLQDANLETAQLYQGKSGILPFLERIIDNTSSWPAPNSYVRSLTDREDWHSGKCPAEMKGVIADLANELRPILNTLLEYVDANAASCHFLKLLESNIYSMALANEVNRQISDFKKDNNFIQLDDFNKMIADIVSSNPVPYIYERVGERLRHFLIDEFQDTSYIQWHNLSPLLENALSEGHESLIVGDTKQAIYRWRGGEVALLSDLPVTNFGGDKDDVLWQREQVFVNGYVPHELNTNYRSTEVITGFVNSFFDRTKQTYPDIAEKIYHKHEQSSLPDRKDGSVEVKFFEPEDIKSAHLEEVVDSMNQFAEMGYGYGQMAVLCKTNKECQELAIRLLAHKIPIISEDSLKLAASPAVQFLIDCFKYRYLGQHDVHAFCILQFLSERSQLDLVSNDALLEGWKKGLRLKDFRDKGGTILDFGAEQHSLLEFCFSLVDRFLSELPKDLFLINFENYLSKFVRENGNDPVEFLTWWEEGAADLKVELSGNNDAVKIMTIYKAKGLEFDIVFLPFTYGKIKPRKDFSWVTTTSADAELLPVAWLPTKDLADTDYSAIYEEEMERSVLDSINLLYVGMTRAGHHLRIYSKSFEKRESGYYEEHILYDGLAEPSEKTVATGDFICGAIGQFQGTPIVKIDDSFKMEIHPSGNWKNKLQLKFRSDDEPLISDSKNARQEGNLIHSLMADVRELKDLKSILDSGRFKEDASLNVDELLEQVHGTILGSAVEPYFVNVEAAVLNERDILTGKGRFRPDRTVISGDEIAVIDYKTGTELESHKEQMRSYTRLMEEMGYRSCRAFLIYFGTRKIVEV